MRQRGSGECRPGESEGRGHRDTPLVSNEGARGLTGGRERRGVLTVRKGTPAKITLSV